MRLMYLTANAAWVFTFGSQLLRLYDEPMFFPSYDEAVAAAKRRGLMVRHGGEVSGS